MLFRPCHYSPRSLHIAHLLWAQGKEKQADGRAELNAVSEEF